MRAMVLERCGSASEAPLVLDELPVPTPGPGEVLVRVSVCGVCRTDLHVIEAELPTLRLPLVPGHQIVGQVVASGPGCHRFEFGARVGIAWLRYTCGQCPYCTRGYENLCEHSLYTGYHADGGYAEYATVAEDWAYPIPSTLGDAEAAPLLCAGIIGYRALALAELPPGGTLALYGFGSSAHIVAQLARHRGARVLVATRGSEHRRLARELGATWAGDATEDLPEPADSAIVFAPAGEIVPAAMRSLRKGGTCVLAGIYMSPTPPMDYEACLFHEKRLRSVEANTRDDAIGLLAEAAAIPIRARVREYPLECANDALRDLAGDAVNGSAVLRIRH
jgi:propanol-preferring alcohol dehydrogenase